MPKPRARCPQQLFERTAHRFRRNTPTGLQDQLRQALVQWMQTLAKCDQYSCQTVANYLNSSGLVPGYGQRFHGPMIAPLPKTID
jgi:hypothetical protein